jgi:hypothetical protein
MLRHRSFVLTFPAEKAYPSGRVLIKEIKIYEYIPSDRCSLQAWDARAQAMGVSEQQPGGGQRFSKKVLNRH